MLLFEFEQEDHVGNNVVYNNTLNPKLYDENGDMRSDVHAALMKIADNFITDLDIPDMQILDVVLTGSSANFNYNKYSDIDLHLISDIDVFADPHMAAKYFTAAKNVWNNNHNVTINGLDAEVYIEDDKEHNESLGRFSVMNNQWLTKPTHNKPVFDKDAVNAKVRYIMKEIDMFMDDNDQTITEIEHVKQKIWDMRKAGLESGGEFSVENLAFKVLRNMGYLDKILGALKNAEDDELTLEGEWPAAPAYNKCGWCGSATDSKGNPTGAKGRANAKKVNGKCCPGGSPDYQSQQEHEREMRTAQ